MNTDRLIKINQNAYLLSHRFNQMDYDKVNKTIDLMTAHHHSGNTPKIGDLVEGAYYDGTCPYKFGRIESIEDGKVVVCCHAYVPFVGFNSKARPHLSISGGPFITYRLEELQHMSEDKAMYAIWGCSGPCANGAIHVEAPVNRWRIPYERMPLSYVSEVDKIDRERFPQHDAKVILHKDHMQFFARYGSMKELKALADLIGFTLTLDEKASKPGYRHYRLSHQLTEGKGFWRLSDLPEGAKPFITYENGSLCTCYFLRNDDEKEIVIFRPNPNSKEVYDAFSFEDQIRYKRLHGDAGPKFS